MDPRGKKITRVELVSLELEDSGGEFTGVELASLELEESHWDASARPRTQHQMQVAPVHLNSLKPTRTLKL